MAETIQRVPNGLSELLSTFGGNTPKLISNEIHGVIDLLQFYGLTQRQVAFTNNAALAEAGTVVVTPSATAWSVLFAAAGTISKTATMTALRATLFYNRGGLSIPILGEELGPFGATETGSASFGLILPYPLLLPPGSQVILSPTIIGTDANANCTVQAEFGVLG